MSNIAKPELATNRAGDTVAEALNGFISHAATGLVGGARVDIATAYFNLGGFSLLADSLDQATGVRLLLGAEPTPPERRKRKLGVESAIPERAARTRLKQALASHEHSLAHRPGSAGLLGGGGHPPPGDCSSGFDPVRWKCGGWRAGSFTAKPSW